MRELLLLRHAKSAWDVPGLDDHDRDLAPRGVEAVPRMGRLIEDEGWRPDLVLCSTATRARRTLDLAMGEFAVAPEVKHLKSLYLASPGQLLAVIRRQADDTGRLLLVGHNPGMETLARRLVRASSTKPLRRLERKFPTAALARIGFDADHWSDIEEGQGDLLAFIRPKDLV